MVAESRNFHSNLSGSLKNSCARYYMNWLVVNKDFYFLWLSLHLISKTTSC